MTAHVKNSYIRKVICNSWGGLWRASQMVRFSSENEIHVKPRFSKYSSERPDTNFNKIFTFATLQSGNFWILYEYGIVCTLNPHIFLTHLREKIQPSSSQLIFKMVLSAMLSLLYCPHFSFTFYNVCAVLIFSLMKAALPKRRSFICNYQRLTYHPPPFNTPKRYTETHFISS